MIAPTSAPLTIPMCPPSPVKDERRHHAGTRQECAEAEACPAFACPGGNDQQREYPEGNACRYVEHVHAGQPYAPLWLISTLENS